MAEKDNQQPEKVNTPNSSDGEDETMDITSDEDKRKKKKRIAIKDYQQPETTIIPNSIDGGDDISDEDETQDIPSDSPENEEEDYLTVQDAKKIISVMFEAIRFSDVSKAQLVSAAKKFKLKS
ncbi:uncharacterized protein LOC110243869 [Exaiptasia diaphana]|uniref:Uncharacterized protein n=1 Tax=Exaiptasia diaphana TaxID=2652724 RepID=A0A913XKB8_EXADI|nr:uncharacterized protein LOC110243869 [Exaiptasia diaphana]KXJ25732.1 hypothetical protein AC249_AIPGENE2163 [Exaiptasia diaphana]